VRCGCMRGGGSCTAGLWRLMACHPGVELRANLEAISHKCHLFEVAFVWELTQGTIHLPLSCLQGGVAAAGRGSCLLLGCCWGGSYTEP